MTEKTEVHGEASLEESESAQEQTQVIEEEKDKPEKLTSHQNGAGIRLRKTKRSSGNKSENLAKKNQEIKKLLAKSAASKNKTSSSGVVEKLKGLVLNVNVLRVTAFILIIILTICTRFHKLDDPTHICWDETHFGKHANFYIKGEFFFDVHPPLAKMLIAMAGYLSGYDGSFPFDKPGDPYGENNYVGMRFLCALLGSLCIPLAYLMVWELTKSTAAAILAAGFILFDNGCVTISQYILLDPILMFFIMLSAFCLTKFHSYKNNEYSFCWWYWMVATGISLSCAFSCKWVGLFVIIWAGISTAMDLWDLLGNLELSLVDVAKHLFARVFGLIIVPIFVYLFWFAVHFKMLPNTGPGDGFFSSAFQSTLKGNQLYMADVPADLAFGSLITMKNHRGGGALLHSHSHLYPKEHPPEQQQVTGYSHKDDNNRWIVKKAYEDYNSSKPVELLKNGDWIRLEHIGTKRNLHSHNEKPPLSKHHMQVTAYGDNGKGDANDFWRIEIVSGSPDGHIKTVKTVFRLIHVTLGCALHMSTKTLPKWGWEQLEVSCNPVTHHENNLWNIEGHENDRVPKGSPDLYKPSFLESVYESHLVMAQTNSGFKPKEGEVTSKPWQWPINYKGQVFSGADNRVYLLGNPLIWWFILSLLMYFLTIFSFYAVRVQRGYTHCPQQQARRKHVESIGMWLLLAWALHYFPFFVMGRVLYFHHYFPAYLFSAMFAGIVCEYMCEILSTFVKEKWRTLVYNGGVTFIVGMSVFSFYLFRGLSYGMSGPMAHSPNKTAAVYKWMESWEV